MEETFLTRENLYECTELEDRNDLAVVNCANLWNCSDAVDPVDSLVHRLLVKTEDIYNTLLSAIDLLLCDSDSSTCLALDLLDSLTTLTDDSTDELAINDELNHTWNELLVLSTWLADSLHHLTHDVETTLTCLLECLCENVV